MGEQPKPVSDEVERALTSMRAGFLSGSEQIAAGIASLEEYLASAPNEERAAVRAAVGRLVATHERIVGKVAHLPPSSWDSFKVLVSAVKAQQAVLDQVSHLVQEHVLPRQLQNLSAAPFPGAPPLPDEEPLPQPAPDLFPPAQGFHADDGGLPDGGFRGDRPFRGGRGFGSGFGPDDTLGPGDGLQSEAGAAFQAQPGASFQRRRDRAGTRGQPEAGFPALTRAGLRMRASEDVDDDDSAPRSLLALARERTAGFRGLAAMLAVGIVLSVLPREKLQEVGVKLFELMGPGPGETTSEDRPPTQIAAAAAPRSVERVPPASDRPAAPPPAPATIAPPVRQPAAVEREDAPPAAQAAPTPVAAPAATVAPVAAPAARVEPAAAPAEEQFVPVVFTHKDRATVLRALADLKHQYPNILIGMQGEVQPLNLGKKGIWHRLVFLPPGPRPRAARVCDQLAAEGYDRCWVKAY